MELITAIVLVCGLNLGNAKVNPKSIDDAMIRKQKCITELAKCMAPVGFKGQDHLIQCIGNR